MSLSAEWAIVLEARLTFQMVVLAIGAKDHSFGIMAMRMIHFLRVKISYFFLESFPSALLSPPEGAVPATEAIAWSAPDATVKS